MTWNTHTTLLTTRTHNARNATPCSVCSITRRCATFDVGRFHASTSRFQICAKCLIDSLAELLRIDRTRNRYNTKNTTEG